MGASKRTASKEKKEKAKKAKKEPMNKFVLEVLRKKKDDILLKMRKGPEIKKELKKELIECYNTYYKIYINYNPKSVGSLWRDTAREHYYGSIEYPSIESVVEEIIECDDKDRQEALEFTIKHVVFHEVMNK